MNAIIITKFKHIKSGRIVRIHDNGLYSCEEWDTYNGEGDFNVDYMMKLVLQKKYEILEYEKCDNLIYKRSCSLSN